MIGTKSKNIIFNVKLSDEIPNLPLIADQVEQVFVNILLNAVDALNELKDKIAEEIKKLMEQVANQAKSK